MEINLTGLFWRWPFNLTGSVTGQDKLNLNPIINLNLTGHAKGSEPVILRPSLEFNLSDFNLFNMTDFNIFNFSGEATAHLNFISVFVSIVTIIGISIVIFSTLIRCTSKINFIYKGLQYETKRNDERLNVYSRLCGQRILVYNYNIKFLHALSKEGIHDREELMEKLIACNRDLIRLIALAQALFPDTTKKTKSLEGFIKIIKDILWLRDGDEHSEASSIYTELSQEKGGKLEELKLDIELLDKSIRDLLFDVKNYIDMIDDKEMNAKCWWRIKK